MFMELPVPVIFLNSLIKVNLLTGLCSNSNFPSLSKVAIPFAVPKWEFTTLMLLVYTQNGGQH